MLTASLTDSAAKKNVTVSVLSAWPDLLLGVPAERWDIVNIFQDEYFYSYKPLTLAQFRKSKTAGVSRLTAIRIYEGSSHRPFIDVFTKKSRRQHTCVRSLRCQP